MKYVQSIVVALFFSTQLLSQVDSLRGDIKSISEELIYLDSSILENIQKNDFMESIYGHAVSMRKLVQNYEKTIVKQWYHFPNTRYRKYKRTFDKDKRLLVDSWFEGEKRKYHIEYFFDEEGDAIQEKTVFEDEEPSYVNAYYDNHKRISEIIFSINDDHRNEFLYKRYTYDNKGNVILEVSLDNRDHRHSVRKIYDEKGNILREIVNYGYEVVRNDKGQKNYNYTEKGVEFLLKEFEYNEAQQLIIENRYEATEKNISKHTAQFRYTYDENNLLVRKEQFRYPTEKLGSTTHYRYDRKNRKISAEHISALSEQGNRSQKYLFDENGKILQLIYKDINGEYEVDFTYQFDLSGNWIEKTKIINGIPSYKLVREIEYFD